jgi:hypothetical protein
MCRRYFRANANKLGFYKYRWLKNDKYNIK